MFAVVPMSAWPASICVSLRLAAAQKLGYRRVPGLVHRPVRQPGPFHAANPPAVHCGRRKRPQPVLPDGGERPDAKLGADLLRVEQKLVRFGGPVENVPFQLQPEFRVDHRQVANLSCLPEDRQPLAVVVLELQAGQLALAQTEPEQDQERHAVALPRLRRNQLYAGR